MADDCIFCKIAAGEIPTETVYADDEFIAFRDIHPAAPQHVLLIPKEHIPTFNDLKAGHDARIGRLLRCAAEIASRLGLSEGYRLVGNCQRAAGQEVFHIHVHILGGRKFGWPPG
jgi:histidine triad (HIT) family protein